MDGSQDAGRTQAPAEQSGSEGEPSLRPELLCRPDQRGRHSHRTHQAYTPSPAVHRKGPVFDHSLSRESIRRGNQGPQGSVNLHPLTSIPVDKSVTDAEACVLALQWLRKNDYITEN